MESKITHKFIKTSPRKLRLVATMAKKLKPVQALEILPHSGKRAADPLLKAIKAAIASAKEKGASPDHLVFKEIQINEGPRLKRGRSASRGRFAPYKRRMSHIQIVLEEKKEEKKKIVKKTEKEVKS